ncbi:zinc finger chc2-type [Lucifera butyrica]|uniref:DNA primase n=1 Tax=Lucifera butyrica TaxID=1351585 RepID=A0A498R4K0_9FIRM|nr:DNA primase [Lucifera butyrica]VBB06069.1 zinc finger chc2-type [Lucifera butyrica]
MKDVQYEDLIERLRAEGDIVNIISDYVPLKKRGKNFWGCCPFHHENTPSFSVTPDKGFFYCFGCHTGGNIFSFLMKIENVGFMEAVKILANKMNIPLPEKEKSAYEREREKEIASLFQANELARNFFHSCLTKTDYGINARNYLAHRGITAEIAVKFRLGYAPAAWDKLSNALLKRNLKADILLKAGLAVHKNGGEGFYDRFRDRIIFPICNARGKVVGFGGRIMDQTQPKYLNSPETPIFNKRHILYGLDIAGEHIRSSGQAIVVEGYMDAITAHAHGMANVVASLGTAFTAEQAKPLLRYGAEIIFAYDSDAAGQNATLRALSIVRVLGAKVRVVKIPDGKDPDEFIRKHGIEEFRTLVKNAATLIDYQLQLALETIDHTTLEGKVAVVGKIVPVLADSNNAVEVNAYIIRLSQTLGVAESAIRSELRKYLTTTQKDKNVKTGKNMDIITMPKAVDTAAVQAERQMIRLMCDDSALIPYVQVQIDADSIEDTWRREIVHSLFNAFAAGGKIEPVILAMNLSEKANAEFSHIMLLEFPCTDVSRMIDDCIRAVKLSHLNLLYEQHRLRADELQRMGDSNFLQELAESQRIKDEISKLYKP